MKGFMEYFPPIFGEFVLHLSQSGQFSSESLRTMSSDVRVFIGFCGQQNVPNQMMQEKNVLAFVNDGKSPAHKIRRLLTMRKCVAYMVEKKIISDDYLKEKTRFDLIGKDSSRYDSEPLALMTDEEVALILEEVMRDATNYLSCEVVLYVSLALSGGRTGEIMSMSVGDVVLDPNDDSVSFIVGDRVLKTPPFIDAISLRKAVKMLRETKTKEEKLFSAKQKIMTNYLFKLGKRCGLKPHFFSLRQYGIAFYYKQGLTLKEVAKIFGITRRYAYRLLVMRG